MQDNSLYGQFLVYLFSPMFWLAIVVTSLATILPDMIWYIKSRIGFFERISRVIHSQVVEVEDRETNFT